MNEFSNKILEIVTLKGPVLPIEISKGLRGVYEKDLLFFSAILSDLVSQKRILVTRAKIGSSPLYYEKGQEEKIERLYPYLKEVERESYDLVKQNKILRDSDLHPHQRVAMRAIKDFAIPLEVEEKGNKELFWKWYLTPNEEAKELLKPFFKEEKIKKEEKKEKPEEKAVETRKEKRVMQKPEDYRTKIVVFFQENKIAIIDENIIRRNNDMEFIIKVPTALGETKFFAKIKNKKAISKADIALAQNIAATKKLPLIFITSGEISKKTSDYAEKHLEGVILKRIK